MDVAVLVLVGERRARPSAARPRSRPTAPARRGPAAELVTLRVSASSIARWSVDLPASLGPRTTVRPGRELERRVAVAAQVPEGEARDPHSVTSRPASRSRPSRSTSSSSSASRGGGGVRRALEGGDPRLDIADERAGDGLGGRDRALRQRRVALVADADPQEVAAQRRLDLVDVEVELVRADADQPDVEHRGPCSRRRGAWRRARAATRRVAASISLRSNVVLPTTRSSTATVLRVALPVERHEQHLAGLVLVERDGLRGARVGVRHAAGLGDLGAVPVAEREVVEPAGGDLVLRDHDVVVRRSGPGIAIAAWSRPMLPGGLGRLRRPRGRAAGCAARAWSRTPGRGRRRRACRGGPTAAPASGP